MRKPASCRPAAISLQRNRSLTRRNYLSNSLSLDCDNIRSPNHWRSPLFLAWHQNPTPNPNFRPIGTKTNLQTQLWISWLLTTFEDSLHYCHIQYVECTIHKLTWSKETNISQFLLQFSWRSSSNRSLIILHKKKEEISVTDVGKN